MRLLRVPSSLDTVTDSTNRNLDTWRISEESRRMSQASHNPESEDRGRSPRNGGESPRLPQVDLALVERAEREAAVCIIQELHQRCLKVDEMLRRAVDMELLQQYQIEQFQVRNRIEAKIDQLTRHIEACREWLKASAKRLHAELTLCADDLRESFTIAQALGRSLGVDTSIGDFEAPEDCDCKKSDELKQIVRHRALELKDFVCILWQEVLWLAEGRSEQDAWLSYVSRRSVRAAGVEGIVEQLEGVSYRIDAYLNRTKLPFPEELEAQDARRRFAACKRELRSKRSELGQLNQEYAKTDKTLLALKSTLLHAPVDIRECLVAMCDSVSTLIKQCQARPSLILSELQASEARVKGLQAGLVHVVALDTPQGRGVAREVVREIEGLCQWIDLTQNLNAFGTAQDSLPSGRSRITENHGLANRPTEKVQQYSEAGQSVGTHITSSAKDLLRLVRSGFGSKLIKEPTSAFPKFRSQSGFHLRRMTDADAEQVLRIDCASSTQPWSLEELHHHKSASSCIPMVVEAGETLVGFMLYEVNNGMLRVLKLAVDPQHQRRGIGFLMVEKLLEKLGGRRESIEMEIRETNVRAQQFLKACGFKATAVLPGWFKTPEEDAFVFRASYREIQELRKLGRAKG